MDVGGDGLGVVGGFVGAKEVGARVEVDDFRRLYGNSSESQRRGSFMDIYG